MKTSKVIYRLYKEILDKAKRVHDEYSDTFGFEFEDVCTIIEKHADAAVEEEKNNLVKDQPMHTSSLSSVNFEGDRNEGE